MIRIMLYVDESKYEDIMEVLEGMKNSGGIEKYFPAGKVSECQKCGRHVFDGSRCGSCSEVKE